MSTINVALHKKWGMAGWRKNLGTVPIGTVPVVALFGDWPSRDCPQQLEKNLSRQRQLFKPVIMMVGRTELTFDHCGAFEIVADGQFLCDADAAMGLDGVLANKFGGPRYLRLAGGYGGHAFGGRQVELQCRHCRHGFALFNFHEHIDHAVLQHLKARDGLAKLVTLARIFQRALMQLECDAAGFGADRYCCFVDNLFDQRKASTFSTEPM